MEKKELTIKQILEQLIDLKEEYKDKQEAIKRLEEYIIKLEQEGYTEIDSVTGGNGGKQHFVIEGVPYPLYSYKKTQLQLRKMALEKIREKINQQIIFAEKIINEQENSRIRRLLTYRYVEGLTWTQVAYRMGKKHTADSCQKAVERFLKNL